MSESEKQQQKIIHSNNLAEKKKKTVLKLTGVTSCFCLRQSKPVPWRNAVAKG